MSKHDPLVSIKHMRDHADEAIALLEANICEPVSPIIVGGATKA